MAKKEKNLNKDLKSVTNKDKSSKKLELDKVSGGMGVGAAGVVIGV